MIQKTFHNIKLPELGFGALRLPTKTGKLWDDIDRTEAQKVIDYAMEQGINFFDTAHAYGADRDNEKSLGEMLSKYPRSSYYLATKYLNFMGNYYDTFFDEQLEYLKTDYIDFYMIHSVFDDTYEQYLSNGSIEYLAEQKQKGRIKYLGFSSHASVETLKALTDYCDWDFAMIQLNYFDWLYGRAKDEYEFLVNKGLPIIVMEPVRGGRLASLPVKAEAMLKAANPDWSIASWAFRWLRTLPSVQMVLSGMSTIDQVKENSTLFSDAETILSEKEKKILFDACKISRENMGVLCTNCLYCVPECPVNIDIPHILEIYNKASKQEGEWTFDELSKVDVQKTPFKCVKCGICESRCPQQIGIVKIMAEIADWQSKTRNDR